MRRCVSATVPVELDLGPPTRFAAHVEVAGCYVVAEALTNTAKHANASRARVLVEERDGRVCISIGGDDDRDGGGELEGGFGLSGIRDRVEALGGSFRLSKPARPRHGGRRGVARDRRPRPTRNVAPGIVLADDDARICGVEGPLSVDPPRVTTPSAFVISVHAMLSFCNGTQPRPRLPNDRGRTARRPP